jgi:hypothetical protein
VRDNVKCSFCGKPQKRVGKLIAGPGSVYICDECVDLCQSIIGEELSNVPGESSAQSGSWKIEVEVSTSTTSAREQILHDVESWRRVADRIVVSEGPIRGTRSHVDLEGGSPGGPIQSETRE